MKYNDNRTIERGDIYWFTDSGRGIYDRKYRPGVVVSSDKMNSYQFNGKPQDIEVVFLTTNAKADLPTHCTINSAEQKSTALCEKITTVPQVNIGTRIGHVSDEEMRRLEICMAISIGVSTFEKKDTDTEAQSVADSNDELTKLKYELAKAQHGERIMKELYQELLDKTLGYTDE